MAESTERGKALDRRGFLRGSAFLAAAAVGLSAAGPAFAQQSTGKPEEKKPEEKKPEGESKSDPAKDPAKKETPSKQGETAKKDDPNRLIDKDGREYRVCERCGGNMYKEGNTWTCEQCGLSYVE